MVNIVKPLVEMENNNYEQLYLSGLCSSKDFVNVLEKPSVETGAEK